MGWLPPYKGKKHFLRDETLLIFILPSSFHLSCGEKVWVEGDRDARGDVLKYL